jgi:trans-2,3-dihydro-3-hydroxyanthranilate isomerase
VSHRIHTVDVFTDMPLAGNQLAVVLDAEDIAGETMQRIAREFNIAETTFVLPPHDPTHAARVRIFTPGAELPFAGHPTIGTAWVLATQGLVPGGGLEFILEEGVGPIKVRGVRDEHGGLAFWMAHPAVSFGDVFDDRAAVAASLGLEPGALAPNVPLQVVSTGVPFLFVALTDKSAVDAAISDTERLSALFAGRPEVAVYLFAADAARPNQLYSRMFAGHTFDIREDPATGSAAGPLGAFVVRYGLVPRAPSVTLVSEQGTKMGRQSFIHIELAYDKDEEDGELPTRIEVGGAVQPVIEGELLP